MIWITILALLNGCVPSLATPVPPLYPNAINLYIAQTANAASTQTMKAMPPSTSTATVTPTPRNTNTPEPTGTTIPTFIFPSPTPVSRLYYFRVKHDSQLAVYNYEARFAHSSDLGLQTPETVPLFVQPKPSTGTNRTRLDGAWASFLDSLNNNDPRKLRYLKADNSGLFNGSGFPQLESLTMGGNIIVLDQIQGMWGRVYTLDYGKPPNAGIINYVTRPDLVHKFVVVGWSRKTKQTYWTNPPKGDMYWPLVSSRPVWIQMERLEGFPGLPVEVTADTTQSIRTTPDINGSMTGYEFSAGESATIVEYHPSASSVWARLGSGGWIALLLYAADTKGPQYFTSWKMETVPPPP